MSDHFIELDKEAKKAIVMERVAAYCHELAEYQDLRDVGTSLEAGDTLCCDILSGGKTNYSYKVYLKDDPTKAVFAKLSFAHALWNPDRVYYDLKRSENEFIAMKEFKKMMGSDDPVATPYICDDVSSSEEELRLLVTQWAPADQQLSIQFAEGNVDHRVVTKLAHALGKLNTSDFDPEFNDQVRPCMLSFIYLLKSRFAELIRESDQPVDSFVVDGRQLGTESFSAVIDGMVEDYMHREALIHADTHTFNILVEKSSPRGDFGEHGSVYICDWEMTVAGPVGKDPGTFMGWAIVCSMCHAVQGHRKEALHLLSVIDEFWDEYASVVVATGKDEALLGSVFKSAIGWAGFFVLPVCYMYSHFGECLPLEGVPDDLARKAKGAFGSVGLRLLVTGFGGDKNEAELSTLRPLFHEILSDRVHSLISEAGGDCYPRLSSCLRRSGRRTSDAFLLEEVARQSATGCSLLSSLRSSASCADGLRWEELAKVASAIEG